MAGEELTRDDVKRIAGEALGDTAELDSFDPVSDIVSRVAGEEKEGKSDAS